MHIAVPLIKPFQKVSALFCWLKSNGKRVRSLAKRGLTAKKPLKNLVAVQMNHFNHITRQKLKAYKTIKSDKESKAYYANVVTIKIWRTDLVILY